MRAQASFPRGMLLLLLLSLVVLFLALIWLGSVNIPMSEVLHILFGHDPDKRSNRDIVLQLRVPRACTAALAGAALSVAGLVMQTLFRNPLAGPFELGISAGASLGVAVVVLGGGIGSAGFLSGLGHAGHFATVIAASLGAGMVFAAVSLVARRVGNITTLLILGLMFGTLAGGLVSVILYFSAPERVQGYVIWLFGNFGKTTWPQLRLFAAVTAAGTLAVWLSSKSLNALLLGEAYAGSMGIHVRRSRLRILGAASLLAGATTAFCGPVAFLGLATPHVARGLLGTAEHRVLVPMTMLLGANAAMLSDLIAQLPGSSLNLPLNAVTSVLGAPVVMWIVLRRPWQSGKPATETAS